jgi:hypothetical protein
VNPTQLKPKDSILVTVTNISSLSDLSLLQALVSAPAGSAGGAGGGQCPAASAKSEDQCAGIVANCWSPGMYIYCIMPYFSLSSFKDGKYGT